MRKLNLIPNRYFIDDKTLVFFLTPRLLFGYALSSQIHCRYLVESQLASNNSSIRQGPVIIASSQGGVSIEDVAAESPEAITYEPIDIKTGMTDDQICRVLKKVAYLCPTYLLPKKSNY